MLGGGDVGSLVLGVLEGFDLLAGGVVVATTGGAWWWVWYFKTVNGW